MQMHAWTITDNVQNVRPGITPLSSMPVYFNRTDGVVVKKINPPRMFDWFIISILLTLAIYVFAPQQLPVTLYKLSLVALAAWAGYWIDRSLFPYARPDNQSIQPYDIIIASAMLRRAIIVAATIVAVSLGA